MADMKVMTLKVDVKDKDVKRLGDDLGKIEVQAVKAASALELIQGILTSYDPVKNIGKIIPTLHKVEAVTTQLNKIAIEQMQKSREILEKNTAAQLEAAKKIDEASKKELDALRKDEHERKKKLEKDKKHLEKHLAAIIAAEKETGTILTKERKKWDESRRNNEKAFADYFAELGTKRQESVKDSYENMLYATDKAYRDSKELIESKYALEEQTIRNATDLALAAEDEKLQRMRVTTSDEVGMTSARNVQLKDLETRKNAELKKLEQEHQKARAEAYKNFLTERGKNLEVESKDTLNKLEKSTKKTMNSVKDFFVGMDEETKKSIIETAAKQQKAAKDAEEAAKKTATATGQATAAKKEETTATKQATAATTQATEAVKKYLDITATRYNYQTQVEEYKKLQLVRQEEYNKQLKHYAKEEAAAEGNAEKIKEIQNKKKAYTQQYGVDIITIQQTITAAEKKEQDLSTTQWVQYAQKGEEVANSIKAFTGKVGDYFTKAFTAMSDVQKAKIAAIDEDLKQLAVKKDENLKEESANAKLIEQLKKDLAQAEKDKNEEAIQSINERILAEQTMTTEIAAQKLKLENEEAQLNLKKAKKQKEQEKIEKLNRKAALLKNIGEATANVAQGITATLKAYPFPLNAALAAVVGAAGAVQIGIMTKQLAKFEDGGLLRGRRHAQGGMRIQGSNIEVEGGEYVVNRESTNKNLGLIRYINAERRELAPSDINAFFSSKSRGYEPPFQKAFENGGQLPVLEAATNINNEELIQAIRSIRIEPKVAVTDIYKMQDTMVSVDGWTGA